MATLATTKTCNNRQQWATTSTGSVDGAQANIQTKVTIQYHNHNFAFYVLFYL
jgi:hypothetical protein